MKFSNMKRVYNISRNCIAQRNKNPSVFFVVKYIITSKNKRNAANAIRRVRFLSYSTKLKNWIRLEIGRIEISLSAVRLAGELISPLQKAE